MQTLYKVDEGAKLSSGGRVKKGVRDFFFLLFFSVRNIEHYKWFHL